MREGQTFSVDHVDGVSCIDSHGAIPHEHWVRAEMALEASLAEPEPWELNDFVAAANRATGDVRLVADIRMQYHRDQGQESFELWAFPDEGPDHIVVADFAVNPMVGTDWPKLRFMLSALRISPDTPWSIAGPIAALARERKVPVG